MKPFFFWLKDLYLKNEEDPFLLQEFLEIAIPYYEEKKEHNKLIFLYFFKAKLLMDIGYAGSSSDFSISIQYFIKVTNYRNSYHLFPYIFERKFIFLSYYLLLLIIPMTKFYTLSSIDMFRAEFHLFWNSDIVKKLDGRKQEFILIADEIECQYKNICFQLLNHYDGSKQLKNEYIDLLKKDFSKQISFSGSIYYCDPILVSSYYKSLLLNKELSKAQYWRMLEQYFYKNQYSLKTNNENKILNIIHLQLYFPIELLNSLNQTKKSYKEKNTLAKKYLSAILDYFKKNTKFSSSFIFNQKICEFCFHPTVLKSFDSRKEKEHFILKFILCRHLGTFIHSIMVSKIGTLIAMEIIRSKPSLFIGLFHTKSISDVHQKKSAIINFVRSCGLFHDIGKYGLINIIDTQSRTITDKEFKIIKTHSNKGFEYLNSDPDLKIYSEIAYGHHKSYDNQSGYPNEFQTKHSKNKIIIDLISICDCIDAATDPFGRNYNIQKNFKTIFQELLKKGGTIYNPDILKIIKNSNYLLDKLNHYTTRKREEIYYIVCKNRW